jgi:hypothetical protein
MNRWKIATVALAVVAATGWTMTPATSHVAGWAHNWSQHIKPRADKRYYTKAASNTRYAARTVKPGQKLSGVWSVAGGSGQILATAIEFRVPMSGTATAVWAPNDTTHCPGAGQAAAGFLCVYPSWTNAATFSFFVDPGSSLVAPTVRPQGAAMHFTGSSDSANARGTWTLAPSATARVPAAPRRAPSASGR